MQYNMVCIMVIVHYNAVQNSTLEYNTVQCNVQCGTQELEYNVYSTIQYKALM